MTKAPCRYAIVDPRTGDPTLSVGYIMAGPLDRPTALDANDAAQEYADEILVPDPEWTYKDTIVVWDRALYRLVKFTVEPEWEKSASVWEKTDAAV